MPLASARQRPENQKENQAGHSPEERTVEVEGQRYAVRAIPSRRVGMNEITRKPAQTVAELASARQHQKTGRPSWSARWRVPSRQVGRAGGLPQRVHAASESSHDREAGRAAYGV